MLGPGKPSSRGGQARAFTFPEVMVLVGVMALMAGLAAQLLLQGQAFTAKVQGQEALLQASLRLRLELAQWVEGVRPAPWSDPAKTFVQDGTTLVITEEPGVDESNVWRLAVSDHSLVASHDGGTKVVWGPLDQLALAWWTKDSRVLGVTVRWASKGQTYQWDFPWGSRPL